MSNIGTAADAVGAAGAALAFNNFMTCRNQLAAARHALAIEFGAGTEYSPLSARCAEAIGRLDDLVALIELSHLEQKPQASDNAIKTIGRMAKSLRRLYFCEMLAKTADEEG